MLARIIFEPPNNAVLIAQVYLAVSEDIVLMDVCSSEICGKSWYSQVALVSAGVLVLSIVSDIAGSRNQLKIDNVFQGQWGNHWDQCAGDKAFASCADGGTSDEFSDVSVVL